MDWIKPLQIILAILLIAVILLQNRGSGLGGVFGGGGSIFYAKRGLDKKLYIATIIIAILFFATSLAAAVI